MSARTYRKKPVEIQAIQFDGTLEGAIPVMDFVNGRDRRGPASLRIGGTPSSAIVIHTLEGDMEASPGDYIIRGVQGEFYPCKPDIFEATYDAAFTEDELKEMPFNGLYRG